MSATPRATTPSSRCWAISASATTSRNRRSTYAWELVTRDFGLPQGPPAGHRLRRGRRRGRALEARSPACRTSASSASRPRTISGAWATPARAARAREIFYDHGPAIPGGPPGSADEDGDRFIEIWNLVFMQFEEGPPGTRVPLPRPSIDTGMGLERVRRDPAGQARQLRHRHVPRADPGQRRGDRPGPGRPVHAPATASSPTICAATALPDRRRRAAVQRGPRLRAAPDHAPRHAPRRT